MVGDHGLAIRHSAHRDAGIAREDARPGADIRRKATNPEIKASAT